MVDNINHHIALRANVALRAMGRAKPDATLQGRLFKLIFQFIFIYSSYIKKIQIYINEVTLI
jgi:hypothetical protein